MISGPRGWQNSTTSRNFPNSAVPPILYLVEDFSIKIFFSSSEDNSSAGFESWCDVWLVRSPARQMFPGTALFSSSPRDQFLLSASMTSVLFSEFLSHQKSIKFSTGLVNRTLLLTGAFFVSIAGFGAFFWSRFVSFPKVFLHESRSSPSSSQPEVSYPDLVWVSCRMGIREPSVRNLGSWSI